MCNTIIDKKNSDIIVFDTTMKQSIEVLRLHYIPVECREAFCFMVRSTSTPIVIRKAYAVVFKLLSRESSVDIVIPNKFVHRCLMFVESFRGANLSDISDFCHYLRQCCPELASLLSLCPNVDVVSLIQYCAQFVKRIHDSDVVPIPPEPIPSTYNPAKFGRAYYFHEHGCQIRKMRTFTADKTAEHKNFDNVPATLCNKRFPEVSKKGVSYLFLWFCPSHGHCYGYHMIPGSEGRKDPAASLYTHLEEAPDHILYDFACSLSEYCHNRESGYYKNTSFFHDVFHGYTHSCSRAFRCDRLTKFDAVNSSICEQFNSFLQKIKTSAKLMSQTPFPFYLQFFINVWNNQKRENYEKRLRIARSSVV